VFKIIKHVFLLENSLNLLVQFIRIFKFTTPNKVQIKYKDIKYRFSSIMNKCLELFLKWLKKYTISIT